MNARNSCPTTPWGGGGGGGGSTLPFRTGWEACPISLDSKILSRLLFLDLVFSLFKYIFLGSHLAENLYF